MNLTRYILPLLLITALNCSAQTIDTVSVEQKGVVYKVTNTPGSTYNWTVEGGEISSQNGLNYIVINWGNVPGLYNIIVQETNRKACTGTPVIRQVMVEPKRFPLVDGRETICQGEQITLTASGEEPFVYNDLTYLWNTGETTQSIVVKPTRTTDYTVVVKYNGDVQDTAFFTVTVNPPFNAHFTMNPSQPAVDETVRFSYVGSPAASYQWDVDYLNASADGSDQYTIPEFEHTYTEAGKKTIRLVTFNSAGCTDTLIREFVIRDPYSVSVPSAFTPNADGKNDLLQVHIPEGVEIFTYYVFNRWGEKIFQSNTRSNMWDGSYKDQPAPEGAYVIVFEGEAPTGDKVTFKGTVALHH